MDFQLKYLMSLNLNNNFPLPYFDKFSKAQAITFSVSHAPRPSNLYQFLSPFLILMLHSKFLELIVKVIYCCFKIKGPD